MARAMDGGDSDETNKVKLDPELDAIDLSITTGELCREDLEKYAK